LPDTYDQISPFNLPRGKGGVAIAWPQALSSKVTRLSEGNTRVMGILIAINPKVCVIGTYMPTNNPSVNSSIEYAECLDIIQHMVMTYKETHEIIIIGDLNGTLNTPRNYNRHDVLLQSFVHELGIHVEHSETQTFFHHSGASTSQIDYILSLNDKTLKDYRVHVQSAENLSSHVPVSATLNTIIESKKKPGKNTSKSIKKKCNWKKADTEGFQKTLEDELYKLEQTVRNSK
jgi:exonuclease III